jgi:hypothetical protein
MLSGTETAPIRMGPKNAGRNRQSFENMSATRDPGRTPSPAQAFAARLHQPSRSR